MYKIINRIASNTDDTRIKFMTDGILLKEIEKVTLIHFE